MLALGGYVARPSGDVAQPDSALTAIVLGFSLLPAALTLVSRCCCCASPDAERLPA